MSNPGTVARPWSTLQAVFEARKVFVAGDTLNIGTGDHGSPIITGLPTGDVTIQAQVDSNPTLNRLRFYNASNWRIVGLTIRPPNQWDGSLVPIVNIGTLCDHITITQCAIYSTLDSFGWTVADWQAKALTGFSSVAPYTIFTDNKLTNVNFGIVILHEAVHSDVSRNTITNFSGDGMRGLADNCKFEDNTVKNSYVIDGNHDDGFQSWSGGYGDIAVGAGVVENVILRGNIFVSCTDPNQPYKGQMQGIGCFDGYYKNWTVENNLVVTDMWQGLSFFGALNCRLVNNTVVKNPIDTFGFTPWLTVNPHKNGAQSTGNLVRNNLVWKLLGVGVSGIVDHNIVIGDPGVCFVDYKGFNFDLRSTSPAVNTGDSSDAPYSDIDGISRAVPFDVGAYEYSYSASGLLCYEGFNYATSANISQSSDSLTDFGWTGVTWSSVNDVTPSGLSYGALPTNGKAVSFSSNVEASRSIDTSLLGDEKCVTDMYGVRRLGKPGMTLWISFIIRADSVDTDGLKTCGLELLGSLVGGGSKLSIGDTGTSDKWSVKSYDTASSSIAIGVGQPTFLVVQITFMPGSNNDIVRLYVNPALNSAPLVANATLLGRDIGAFDRVLFKGSRVATGDEVRIGTSWTSVIGY
ncbi:MAG: hypothetical protein JWL59_1860 [Chthoniobacteraceae bacterium]|nr:hypothetical protein [Chthoniobacteraceae bacterium]